VDLLPKQQHLKLFLVLNAGYPLPPLQCNNSFWLCAIKHFMNRFLREIVECPSLEIFKSHLNIVLGNWLQVDLLEQESWTR